MPIPSLQARTSAAAGRRRRLAVGRVRLEEHEIASPLIDPRHDGLRVAHLSDLHVSAALRPRRLARVVELLNALRPDLVLFTGDYICVSTRAVPLLTAALSRLRIPAWATLGNHDHWFDAGAVARGLERAGVRVLRNACATVDLRGAPVHLVGIDDPRTGHADIPRAFQALEAGRRGTRVVLVHDPGAADQLRGRGAALILAGHTHGGQISLPPLTSRIARRLGVKYLAGFFDVGESLLYVNRGLGASIPVRFAVPREVALFTLRAAGGLQKRPGRRPPD